jgi:DNA-binding MarR family transcriptional regulator
MADPREDYYERRIAEDVHEYPEADGCVCALFLNLAYTYDIVETEWHRSLQVSGVSLPAFNLLKILQHQPEQCAPLNEIGELLLTSRANITGLVDGLAKKGLVARTAHPTDRRVRLAQLLPAGEQLIKNFLPHHFERMNAACQSLTADERLQFVQLLKKIRQGFDSPD